MPGSMPATSQLDWLISTTVMIVLSWSRATRDLLKSFGWGIRALHQLATATMVPFPRRLPHTISPLAAGGRLGPRSRKGVSVLAEGKRGKGHGDDKRRSRDGEYIKRNRGFESGSLQRRVCESAWNKDPVFGVIGIQSGPPEQWVHSGFRGGHGSQVGDAGSGNDREDPSRVLRSEEANQDDLPRASGVTEGRAQGDPVAGDGVSL